MTDNNEPLIDDTWESQRQTIQQSLNGITAELNSALIKAGLAYPVYVCIPTTGNALLTLACPLDPDDNEWARITKIALEIVGRKIGVTSLQTRALACGMAGATMAANEFVDEQEVPPRSALGSVE
jgi:hypothetical protein